MKTIAHVVDRVEGLPVNNTTGWKTRWTPCIYLSQVCFWFTTASL